MKTVVYPKDFKSFRNALCDETTINRLVADANKKGERETGTGNIMVKKWGNKIYIYQAMAEATLY